MRAKPGDPSATLFGTYYPRDYIVAVLPDGERGQAAVEALRRAGWAGDEVARYDGAAVVANYERHEAEQGVLARVGEALASDERLAIAQYLDEARAGRPLVTVLAPSAARIERARAILAEHGGYCLHHYGAWTMTDLPTTEPTA